MVKYIYITALTDDLISRVKDGEPMDWRYDLGEDVYVLIKAPQLTIHIMKHFVPHGEWTLVVEKGGRGLFRCNYD
jgi:hypothetical protein